MGTQRATGHVHRHLVRQERVCSFHLCRGKAREGGTALSHTTLSHRLDGRRGEVRTCSNGANLEKIVVRKWGLTEVTKATWHGQFMPTVIYPVKARTPKACPPGRGFKYQVLGEQLGPASPGPLPGWVGLVRVREG